jgi:hypothetical protein
MSHRTIPDDYGTDALQDFGSLGGEDFITIPWPYTGSTPIISGISEQSKYKKNLSVLLGGGNFSTGSIDTHDLDVIKTANANDELGDFIGKADIEQTRVFLTGSDQTRPYDMHGILGIVPTGYGWNPYTDNSWWDGNSSSSSFSNDTSAGELYIVDNTDNELRNSCVLELNLGDTDFGVIRDSSGNGNKGILIGDFSLTKISKQVPAMRDSYMEISERDLEDKAL